MSTPRALAVLCLAMSATVFAAAPTATTSAATSVTSTSALLNGAGNPGGEATSGWFRLSTTNPGACDDTFGTRVPSTGGTSLGAGAVSAPYSVSSTGLLPGNTYYFCAVTQNASGTALGTILTFSTPATLPTALTAAATSVTSSAATFNGSSTPNGSATTGFFRYSTSSPGSCNTTFGTRFPASLGTALGSGNGSVDYTELVTGLLAGTTYYYCALATNAVGTTAGNLLSFTTLVAVPAVITTAASSVTGTTATLNGTVNPNGANTTAWFRLSASDPGSCSDVFGTRVPASSGSPMGTGSFASAYAQGATGLTPGTTYYYCSIAQNSQGTTLGSVLTFATPAIPTVSTSAVTNLLALSATLNGNATPNGATALGWFRYSAANPGTCNDSFGSRIPVTAGTGTNLGAGASAMPFLQAISGLTPGTTYFYCALSSNSVGTGFGSLQSFTTPPTAPLVSTGSATLVTGVSATLNAQTNPRGDVTTGWFRYASVDPGSCNDTFGTRAPASGGSSLGSGNGYLSYLENLTGLTPGTTYYFCALSSNSVGTTLGAMTSFTTQNTPTVNTLAASSVAGTSAVLNGQANPNLGTTTGFFRYSTSSPGTCNDTFGTRAPTSGGSGLGAGNTLQSFSQALSGLTPGTTYYFCALASNGVGTGLGTVLSFLTPAAPSVTSLAAAPVTATTATLNGSANPNNAATTGWFRYSATNPSFCDDSFGTRLPAGSGGTTLGAGAAPVAYGLAVGGLLPGTTYYFCALASNSVGTSFGTMLSFTTPPTAPLVITNSVTLVTSSTATLNGQANPRGAATTAWFRYGPADPGTCNDTFGTRAPTSGGTALAASNSYSSTLENLTGLVPGTTYYYCALASNSVGTSVGGVGSFLVPNVPTVTTSAVSGLTGTTVTLGGTGNPNGGATLGWFRYALTNPGSCNDSFGTRAPASSGTNLGASTSPVAYTQFLSGLTPGAVYYYCAIASNLVGTGFGSVLTFTTPAIPTVTTDVVTLVTATTATLNGTGNPNNAAAQGWYRYATTNPVTCNDSFGTRLPSSSGTNLGGGASPVAFPLALTGLLPGTTYYYCAIASNSVGTGFGAVGSFTTPPTAPIVSTTGANAITSNTATLNGTANPRGDATTGWFRYDTVSPGSCNDSFGFRVPLISGSALGSGNGGVTFNQPLTGLSLATTYYYCAIASNSVGTSFGAVASFTTTAAPPAVTTLAATGITTIGASMNAVATPNGADATGWFRYSTTNPGTCSDTFGSRAPASGGTALGTGTSPVSFSVTPATLTVGATYYFCAIASNSAGTSYGAVLSFQTTPTAPTLNTLAATAIGGTTATLNGSATPNGATTTGWFRYATTSPGTCNDSFGTRAPASAGTDLGAGVAAMPYAQALSGLTPGATYYFCAIAQNSLGLVFGLVLSFATPQAPSVVTNAASPVTSSSATLNGSATPNGTAAQGWFRYSTTNPSSCDDSFGIRTPTTGGAALGAGASPVSFAQALSGLSPGTAYSFCALSSNAVGTSFGAVLSFTTPPAAPSVAASAATAIGSTTVTLNASANPNGATTTGYFRYGTSNPGTCSDTYGTRAPTSGGSALGAGTTVVTYTQDVTGLSPGTTYYFCPLAVNSVATAFSGVLSFTTTAAPTVITSAPTSLSSTSATLNGSANPNRDAATGWFRYSTTNPVTCNDTFGTRAPGSGGTSLGAGNTGVAFSQAITGLTQGTTYYVCAVASNAVATSVGSVLTFTTTNAPTPTTLAATVVTGTTATLNGSTNPNGSSATGYFRYSATNPGTCTDLFGTRAPTGTGGTALGSGTAPVSHAQAVSGLTAGTTYYFCALGNNGAGTGFGTLLTFTTPGAPTVTTSAATSVATTTATLEGTASPNGDAATGWFRYSTTNPTTCNDSFGTRAPGTGGTSLGAGNSAVPFTQAITGLTSGTTYYFCALASNTLGTRFGAPVSFTTQAVPVVTTQAASSLSSTGATLNGAANPRGDATTGWFRYSATNPTTCNDTFGTRLPASGGTSLGAGSTAASYLEVLSGLTAGTTYYFCALASNAFGTAVGTVLSFTTTAAPTAVTSAASALSGSGATLNGSGDPNGATGTGWFRYGTTNPVTCNDTFGTRAPLTGGTNLGAGTAAVAYSAAVTGLSSTTTYYFCALVSNAVGTTLGTVLSFTTPAAPAVTTVAASAVAATSATLNGATNPNGLSATAWFRYAATDPGNCDDTFGTRAPTTGGTSLGAGSSAVVHSQPLSGLTSGTTYYFCAIASNTAGFSYGSVLTFTTPGTPVVTTLSATAVTSAAGSLNGNANPAGSAATGFFRYSPTNPVTCNTTFGTRAPASGGTALGSGFTVAPFTEALTGLASATTYYYCAFAQNSLGTTFGTVLSFTTAAGPAVATSAASAVTGTTATLNGSANPRGLTATGWYRYAATNPGSCNDTFGTRAPTTGGTALGGGSSPVGFAESLTGLTPGTTYYFCALASNSAGTSSGSLEVFTTPGPPSVTTLAASGVTVTTATLNGSVTANTAATTGWFRYSATDPGSCDDTFGTRAPATGGLALGTATTPLTYLQALSGLSGGTTYYYCAIASNSFGSRFGAVMSFSTPAAPVVTTLAATAVSGTGATLNGTANPNASASTGWFRYAAISPTTCDDTFGTRSPATGGTALGSGSTAAPYSQALTGLTPGATYYFCALASNAQGTAFGTPLAFTVPAAGPVVITSAASGVTSSTATLNGSGNPGGAATTGWFRYDTSNPGSCNDTFGTRAPSSAGTSLGSGTTAVNFSQALSGLAAGATYYFCAVAQNSAATSFGAVQTFTMPGAPTVSTLPATSITGTGATFNASGNPGGAATTGWFRFGTTNPGTCSDTFGTRAPASSGTALGGGLAVVSFSQSVTGLTPGTTYFVCALASNVVGLTVGAVQTFRTPAPPTVMTSSASNVVGGLATLNGGANPNGAASSGWFRYSPVDPGACNDSFGSRSPSSGGSALGGGTSTQSYSQNLSGLAPGATYFFCALASNVAGVAYGTVLSFTVEAAPPTVVTRPATDLTAREATLNGTANPRGTAATGWFRYATTPPSSCDDTFGTRVPATGGVALGQGTVDAPWSVALTGLKPGLTYYGCAIASNTGGAAFGTVESFKTAPTTPTARTAPAVVGVDGTVTLNGAANTNGMVGQASFRIGRDRPIVCTATFGDKLPPEGLPLSDSDAEVPVSHLLPGATGTFFYCAVAQTEGGTAVGEVQTFTVEEATAGGCGCGVGTESASLLAFGLVLVLRARRRRS